MALKFEGVVFLSVWLQCKCGWQGRGDVGVVIVPLVVNFGGSVTFALYWSFGICPRIFCAGFISVIAGVVLCQQRVVEIE